MFMSIFIIFSPNSLEMVILMFLFRTISIFNKESAIFSAKEYKPSSMVPKKKRITNFSAYR